MLEIQAYVTNHSIWSRSNGKVYDVTKFLEDHPSGNDVLLSTTGKDATDDFKDVGHNDSAKKMMNEYYVGEIDASTIPKKTTHKPPNQLITIRRRHPNSLSSFSSSLFPLQYWV
ncbi:hypothetical protein I3843_01G113000 [Carya illinoinensis]|nr:hypothetical protein I3843_01G113000 [Carya illinoinensis]